MAVTQHACLQEKGRSESAIGRGGEREGLHKGEEVGGALGLHTGREMGRMVRLGFRSRGASIGVGRGRGSGELPIQDQIARSIVLDGEEGGWACNLSIFLMKNPTAEIRWDFGGGLLVGTSLLTGVTDNGDSKMTQKDTVKHF